MSTQTTTRREFVKYAAMTAGLTLVAGTGLARGVPLLTEQLDPSGARAGLGGPHLEWSPEVAARLQAEVDALVERKGLPHAVLAVASGDGALRWAGAAGAADPAGTPMTPNRPYFIASIDKLYVAAATMRLFERGLVDIDAPVAEYLPDALTGRIHVLDGVDHSAEITARHLLTHTSGLADYLEDSPEGGVSLVERIVASGDTDWDVHQTMSLVREELRPHFEPQQTGRSKPKARYSDTNYQLLIALVETLEGATLDRVLDDLLFRPFAMRNTWLEGLSRPPATCPAPAALWFDEQPLELPRFFKAIRSIYSTAEDQIASFRALVDGRVFADPGTFDAMQQWNRLPFPTDATAARAPGWPVEYGLGIKRLQLPRVLTRMRLLPAAIGHTGSTGSWLFYCPELDVYMAGTVDQGTAGAIPYRLTPKLVRILSECAPTSAT